MDDVVQDLTRILTKDIKKRKLQIIVLREIYVISRDFLVNISVISRNFLLIFQVCVKLWLSTTLISGGKSKKSSTKKRYEFAKS